MGKTIIILAVGLAIGLLLASTFKCNKQPVLPPLKPVQTIVQVADKTLIPLIDSLKKRVIASEARNIVLESKLQAAQQNNRNVATKAKSIQLPCDTSHICNDAITGLIEAAAASDSACNETANELKRQNAIKDSLLTAKNKQIAVRDTAVSNAVDNQAVLVDANKVLKKRNFWQRFGNTILKYAAIVEAVVIVILKLK